MSRIIDQDLYRRNGFVDLDSYQTSAVALRRQALRDGKTFRAVRAGVLTVASVLALAVLVATAPTPASRGVASMAQAGTQQVW